MTSSCFVLCITRIRHIIHVLITFVSLVLDITFRVTSLGRQGPLSTISNPHEYGWLHHMQWIAYIFKQIETKQANLPYFMGYTVSNGKFDQLHAGQTSVRQPNVAPTSARRSLYGGHSWRFVMLWCGQVPPNFTHILPAYFTGTWATLLLLQNQWTKPEECEPTVHMNYLRIDITDTTK